MSRIQSQPTRLPAFARPSEAVVYWALLNLCRGAGGLAQLPIKRLARYCGLSASTTNRAVLGLAQRRLITYTPGSNQARPSTFALRGATASAPATASPKIGAPKPNDNDSSQDNYLDDNDIGAAVPKQNASSEPDRVRKLAHTVAECLHDMANLPLYISYCRRYPPQVIMRALQGAREPAPDKIRVSRGALFNYLVQLYGGKRNHNPNPGSAPRKARDGRSRAGKP